MINGHDFITFNGCARQAHLMQKSPLGRSDSTIYSKRLIVVQKNMLEHFPRGAVVTGSLTAALKQTKRLIADGEGAIYGAAFLYEYAACRADIIIKNGDAYDIYIVRPSERFNKYTAEAFFTAFLARKCGVKIGKAYVAAIDKNAEDGAPSLHEALEKSRGSTETKFALISSTLKKKNTPPAALKQRCESCAYFKKCFPQAEDSIFALKSIKFQKKTELYRAGIKTFSDYVASGRKDWQILREIRLLTSEEDVYDRAGIRAFLRNIHYPIGFLDFETAEVFFPDDPAIKPTDTVITQFSYHVIRRKGDEPEHYDFIGDGTTYPEREAARKLIEVIGENDCVLMYSNYEAICIGRLIDRLPEYAEPLLRIKSNLVDLEIPFEKKYLANGRMKGSFGLKKVLPALYPGDRSLNYNYMKIQNGGQAQSVYTRLPQMSESERERAVADLREYCAMDTKAMIKLLEKLIYYAEEG